MNDPKYIKIVETLFRGVERHDDNVNAAISELIESTKQPVRIVAIETNHAPRGLRSVIVWKYMGLGQHDQ